MSRVVCAECQEEGRDGCLQCGKLPAVKVDFDDMDLQMISDALKLRCDRCKGMHLTVTNEEPIAGFPIISYACRDCGFDSKAPTMCEHGRPVGHPCSHCLGINHLDPGEAHYATPAQGAKRCAACGSADVKGEGMGCEIWRHRCLTCGADPA